SLATLIGRWGYLYPGVCWPSAWLSCRDREGSAALRREQRRADEGRPPGRDSANRMVASVSLALLDEDVDMELRRADSGEATELADLWWRSRAAAAPSIPPPVHPAGEVRRFFAEVVLPTREAWVATDADRIIGLMVL